MEELENKLRNRAHKSRALALTGGAVIILIVITIIVAMFSFFESPEVSMSTSVSPTSIQFSDKPVETGVDINRVIDELKLEIKSISSRQTTVMGDFETVYLINALTSSFIRVSAVILAVFLTQVLVNFTRYQFRIADHLDSVADSLTISGGDTQKLLTFVGAISPQHIDFGKQTESPSEKIVDALKAAIEKMPKVEK